MIARPNSAKRRPNSRQVPAKSETIGPSLSIAAKAPAPSAGNADAILVLGMHRSGTSAVAGTLMRLGGAAPRHLMCADEYNTHGYFESDVLTAFHEELLASAGTNWKDWRLFNPGWYRSPVAAGYSRRAKELFETEFGGSALPILKDPRICRFVPFWLDVLRETQTTAHIVIPVRSPLDVAYSLSLRKKYEISVTAGLLLWLRHVLDAEAHSRSEPRSIFAWSDFNSDWRAVSSKMAAETGLSWPRLSDRTLREIDHFLSKDLVHHQTIHSALRAHPDVHEWTLSSYEALLEIARDSSSRSALATLDQVRSMFDQASKMFGPILVDYEVDVENLRGQTHALTNERDLLRVRPDEILAEKATAFAEIAARAGAFEQALGESARDKDALSQALADSNAERDSLREERERVAAELWARQQELAEKAAALSELGDRQRITESSHATAAREAAELRTEQESLRRLVAELLEDRSRQRADAEKAKADLNDELERTFTTLSTERQRAAELADRLAGLESALGQAMRDKDALSQTLAASIAERDAFGAFAKERVAEIAAANLAFGEAQGKNAELGPALERVEKDRTAAHQKLALQAAELVAMNAARIGAERKAQDLGQALSAARADLTDTRRDFREIACKHAEALTAVEAVRSEKAPLEAACADLAANLERAAQEKHGLTGNLDRLSSELQRTQQAEAAAHAKAFAAAQRTHDTELRTLRHQLVDAEAALSHLSATRLRRGPLARILPTTVRRRLLARQLVRSGLLDPAWYSATYPDVRESGLGAAEHYLETGFSRGYRPNPLFDTRYYLARYEDVRRSGVNPLLHYLTHGWREGRDPGPDFQTEFYLADNADVRANGMNPLMHYLRYGRHEGRLPARPA